MFPRCTTWPRRGCRRSTIGVVPRNNPAFPLTTSPHTGALLEIFGITGPAMALIGGMLLLADRLSAVLLPLRSVGTVALTSYVRHILVIFGMGYEGVMAALAQHLCGPLIALTVGRVLHSSAVRVAKLVVRP